jgi:transketolase
VQRHDDTWTLDDLRGRVREAHADPRPSMVILRTHIAPGAPNKQDTASAHGEPLGEEEIRLTKRAYGWPEDASFLVPDDVREHCDRRAQGKALSSAWQERFEAYRAAEPDLAAEFERTQAGTPPESFADALPAFTPDDGAMATRAAGGKMLQALARRAGAGRRLRRPGAVHQHADEGVRQRRGGLYGGRNFHWGIREHGMGSIMNGILAHGGCAPFGATFLVFSDYMRPAVRLAAIMGVPAIYVWTHDSVWLGEDGPTHQPVEHLMALRLIPNLVTFRPLRRRTRPRTAGASRWSARTGRPGCSSRGRACRRSRPPPTAARCAAPTCWRRPDGDLDAIVIASGSEVHDALAARETLQADGIGVRVVSMPSWDLFEMQDAPIANRCYRPPSPPGVDRGGRDAGLAALARRARARDRHRPVRRLGAGKVVARNLGIAPEAVVAAVKAVRGA